MSGSQEEKIGLLAENPAVTPRKQPSFRYPLDLSLPPAWHKKQSLRLAACMVLLAVLILTASKLRILFNPLHLDSMTEQAPPASPRYWLDKLERFGDDLNSSSPFRILASTQVATLRGGISKLLHQSWKSKEIPTSWEAWPESWKENHPDWGYILWTPHDNDLLASLMSPMLKSLYQRMPQDSVKSDLARLLYLKHFGGCFAQMDFESIHPLDGLLKDESMVLARVEIDEGDETVPNAFMCSAAGHPFWDVCLAKVIDNLGETEDDDIAGPRMIHDVLSYWDDDEYKDEWGTISILDPDYVFPISWSGDEEGMSECDLDSHQFDSDKCKESFANAFAISYRPHMWDGKQPA